jgi:hypothetical protein
MSAHAHSAVNYLAEKFAIPGAGEGAVDIFSQEPDGTPYTIYTDVQGSNYGHNHPLALAYVDVILAIKD